MTSPALRSAPAPRPSTSRPPRRRRSAWRVLAWPPLVFVNVPLLVTVAVGLSAAYLPSGVFWWAQLTAVWLPYLALALALAASVPLLAGRWGLFALHLALAGLVLGRALPAERLAAPPAPAEGDLRVVSFNVPDDPRDRAGLGDSVVALVERLDPHLLALQDVYVRGQAPREPAVQVRAVTAALPYALAVPDELDERPGWKDRTTGVPLLARRGGARIAEQEALTLGAEDDGENSMALRTRFAWQGREAVLYNIHLRSFGAEKPWWDNRLRLAEPATWLPYLRRYREVYRLRGAEVEELARAIEAETLPVIVTGDFNSTADNHSYRRLRGARQDAFRVAGGPTWGRTYHARTPFVRIDFVLADTALAVVSARVHDVRFSDHRPVDVRLRWR